MKKQISELLHKTLNYAYCDNCDGPEDNEDCECNRKGQQWRLGKSTADSLAETIIAILESEIEK